MGEQACLARGRREPAARSLREGRGTRRVVRPVAAWHLDRHTEDWAIHMKELVDLVAASAVLYRVRAATKTEVLQQLAQAAADAYGVSASAVFEGALERERLAGTGVDDGVAVPHARLRDLDGPKAVMALLETPQDFNAPDGRPADIVCLLLSPEDAGADHLKALASISRLLRRADLRAAIRAARSDAALYAILTSSEPSKAA
jgi:nitrogen PTS system EIIA component